MSLKDVSIYGENETDFSHNGIILQDFEDEPIINRVLNGRFMLSGVYSIDGEHSKLIKSKAILKAYCPDRTWQLFRINQIPTKTLTTISFVANHIGFDANRNFVENMFVSQGTVDEIMKKIQSSLVFKQRFAYSGDMDGTHQFTIKQNYPIDALIGSNNNAQNFASVCGGELDMDNFKLVMRKRLGADKGFTIDMGLNLDSIEETISDAICPNSLYLIGATEEGDYDADRDEVVAAYIETTEYKVTDENRVIGKYTNSQCQTKQELIDWAKNDLFGKKQVHIPKVSHKVNIVDLASTQEYSMYKELFTLQMGDSLHGKLQKQDITIEERMIEYNYYPRLEMYKDLILGNDPGMYTRTIKEVVQETREKIEVTHSELHDDLLNASKVITGNDGGHVLHWPKNRPSDIVIMDDPDIDKAKQMLRMNKSGIGFSKKGWNGPFETAWTIDGTFIADFIRAGTLRAIDIIGVNITGSTIKGTDIYGSTFETVNPNGTKIKIENGTVIFLSADDKQLATINLATNGGNPLLHFQFNNGGTAETFHINKDSIMIKHSKKIQLIAPEVELDGNVNVTQELKIKNEQVFPGQGGGGSGSWNGEFPPEVTDERDKRYWIIWASAIAAGCTQEVAAALCGNAQGESDGRPTADESGGTPGYGYGLFQWTLKGTVGRDYMISLMQKAGITDDPDTSAAQMKLLFWHGPNGQWIASSAYPYSWAEFLKMADIATATTAFEKNFERPLNSHPERIDYATHWYNKFKDLKIPSGGGDILTVAKSWLGWFYYVQAHPSADLGDLNNPNRNGGTDCSGFVWLVLNKAGYKVPQNMQWYTGSMTANARGSKTWLREISQNDAKAGDVVIVNVGSGAGNDGHTAILIEDWHGYETQIIEMGGMNSNGVGIGRVDMSFGYLLNGGDLCLARPVK